MPIPKSQNFMKAFSTQGKNHSLKHKDAVTANLILHQGKYVLSAETKLQVDR